MLQCGKTLRNVALSFGVSKSAIANLSKRFEETGLAKRRHGSGRKRKTTPAQDRYLEVTALRQRITTAPKLALQLRNASGVSISSRTVIRRLREVGIRPRHPAVRIILKPRHKQARLQFARNHIHWTQQQWTNVLFSDESRFSLQFNDGRLQVYRRKNERLLPQNIIERDRYGGGSVMVWGAISDVDRTELKIMRNGTITATRYKDEILNPIVRPYAVARGNNFIFQQDNARPHTANVVTQFLRDEHIITMNWPACSPDLNPIEHVWDRLQMAISNRPVIPETIGALETALLQEWQQLPQSLLQSIIRSMQRRCQCVIDSRGGHTRY